MKIYDVTLTISDDLTVWPGNPKVTINKKKNITSGDSCNTSQLDMGSHTGTHIDAPYHFEEDGLKLDQIPLNTLIGKVRVFRFETEEEIGLKEVKAMDIVNVNRVLFRTINSSYWKSNEFRKGFTAITSEAARYLVDSGIILVGIDYLSIENFDNKAHETHHILLRNGVIILEGLDLSDINPGDYELIALPLKIKDGDGSPVRAILREL